MATSAFAAATILPGASEAVLLGLLSEGTADSLSLVVVASAANTLGSLVNWICGRFLSAYRDRRWFPVPSGAMERGTALFNRYGVWTLAFAWWPFGGDAITFVAGVMRTPLWLFLILVGLGKTLRYAVIAGFFAGWTG